jgi:hypothetical protein
MTAAQRRQEIHGARAHARRYAARTSGVPGEVGAWAEEPFAIPNYAIHAILMPTGKVLFWGYPPLGETGPLQNVGEAAIWNPGLGTGASALTEVPPPLMDPDGDGPQGEVPAPIYCSGQSLLPNGDVLITGGNFVWAQSDPADPYSRPAGLNAVFTFDPFAERWVGQPAMNAGRWYPSQALLADGRTMILGGYTEETPGGQLTDDLELFSAAGDNGGVGAVELHDEAPRTTNLYPHLLTLPDGDVLLGGPGSADSALLSVSADGQTLSWSELPHQAVPHIGGNAVLRPAGPQGSWRVTQLGGYGHTPADQDGTQLATTRAETIDAREPELGWRVDSPQQLGRSHQNTVLLPDRSMVTIGGGIGYTDADQNYAVDEEGSRRRVELYDRETGEWLLGPAQLEDRAYHSTALLLPDGRVWSAGDDLHGPNPVRARSSEDTAEIYSPPYLFHGPRPRIRRAPRTLHWGDTFGIRAKGMIGPRPYRAVLVAPGAPTHGADMHQRVVPLKIRERYGRLGLDAVSPPSTGVAPPGFYMLFVLSKGDVPSVARWVQLRPDAPDAPRLHRRRN